MVDKAASVLAKLKSKAKASGISSAYSFLYRKNFFANFQNLDMRITSF